MGGNALPNAGTRRFLADEYYQLESEVVYLLEENLFTQSEVRPLKAYRSKDSFGDMDVLVESDNIPNNWIELIEVTFKPKETFKNGNVYSFEYKSCQIDLILTKKEDFISSYCYGDYNDLGNLIGRVAHKLGLKLGHDGLSYVWRIDTHAFRTITLLKDWKDILPVLGYSYERWAEGFATLEDIFEFVVSSRFFNKAIYELDNRNHTSRTRDRKRKTYMEFLKWIDNYEETNTQNALKCLGMTGKEVHLPYLFSAIPNFEVQYEATQKEYELQLVFKAKWNGLVVSKHTGLSGKELGQFMQWMKSHHTQEKLVADVMKINPELMPAWIIHFVEKWKNETTTPPQT